MSELLLLFSMGLNLPHLTSTPALPTSNPDSLGKDIDKEDKEVISALAEWLSWLEHCPRHHEVVGSIPNQGTYLGCVFGPWSEHVQETVNGWFSLTSMFLSLSL